MKVTAQEEYGLRCILQLAAQPEGTPMSAAEIARREGISQAYAEKLLRIMARAGLAQSQRGVNGGYVLARSSDRISLGDVSRALDGVQTTEDICNRHTGDRETCMHESSCRIRPVWQGITDYVHTLLDSISIAQLQRGEAIAPNAIVRDIVIHDRNSPLFFDAKP